MPYTIPSAVLSDYYDAQGNPLPTSVTITDTSGVGASHEITIGPQGELPPAGDATWTWIIIGVVGLGIVAMMLGGGGREE